MDFLQTTLTHLNDFLWTYVIVAILICCALFFTVRTGFVQFRMVGEMFHVLTHPEKKPRDGARHISSFEAFVVALASRIGTGNLAGVATAIYVGGPGAVFWMWVIALLGSASAFIESTLAQLYKRKAEDSFIGGPAYYMKHGLGKSWMGIVFAVLMIVTFGLAYNSVQSNTICAVQEQTTSVSQNTPRACSRPCFTGCETVAVAAALGAEPSPASLLNKPRLMPWMMVTPKPPPANCSQPNAPLIIVANTRGSSAMLKAMMPRASNM